MNYKGPLYGKMGRRYIPLRQTSEDVDKMEKESVDVEYLVRNWVDDSTQLDNTSLREMVLYALREENAAKRKAINRAEKAEARTRALLGVDLVNEPWHETPVSRISIRCDLKSLCYRPEEFCKVIAEDLVRQLKGKSTHF